MWNMVSNIIRGLQDSLVFSVQPTTKDGSMVGIKWRVGTYSKTKTTFNLLELMLIRGLITLSFLVFFFLKNNAHILNQVIK